MEEHGSFSICPVARSVARSAVPLTLEGITNPPLAIVGAEFFLSGLCSGSLVSMFNVQERLCGDGMNTCGEVLDEMIVNTTHWLYGVQVFRKGIKPLNLCQKSDLFP